MEESLFPLSLIPDSRPHLPVGNHIWGKIRHCLLLRFARHPRFRFASPEAVLCRPLRGLTSIGDRHPYLSAILQPIPPPDPAGQIRHKVDRHALYHPKTLFQKSVPGEASSGSWRGCRCRLAEVDSFPARPPPPKRGNGETGTRSKTLSQKVLHRRLFAIVGGESLRRFFRCAGAG